MGTSTRLALSHPELFSVGDHQAAIKELQLAQAALRESQGRLNDILQSAMDAIIALREQKYALDQHAIVATTDVQGAITYVNEKFCAISKYSRDELLGQNHRILNSGHHPKDFFRLMYRTIGNGQVWHGEICNRAKDGSIYWVDTTIVPLLDTEGRPRQYMAIRAEITERKRAEHKAEQYTLELQRSNAELEQFAYIASHDLQEPLRMVASYTELLGKRYQGKLDDRADKYVGYAVEGAHRMQGMINDLLTYSRVGSQAKPPESIDSGAVLTAVLAHLSQLIEKSNAEIICEKLPLISADAVQVGQVFQNLLSNAIKFHGEKHPQIRISAEPVENAWRFSVVDNGIGIEKESAGRIFQMFQRLHTREEYEGSGIGLAIAKRIVERHGGSIWFDSVPGQGSTFYFTMARAKDDSE
jgi:two-component system, chemotaxis family, sensor kinase Cph1